MNNPVIRFIDVSNPTPERIEIDPMDFVWIEGRSEPVMVGDYVHRSEFSDHGTPLQRLAQVVEDARRRGYNSTAPRLLCSFQDSKGATLAAAAALLVRDNLSIQVSSDRQTEVEIRFSARPEWRQVAQLHRGDNVIIIFEKGQGPRPHGEGFFTLRPVGGDQETPVESLVRIDWKNPAPTRPRR